LLYSHNKDGNRTSGHIKELVDAILGGRPVRIVIQHSTYQFATRAEHLWVKNEVVYAQTANAWCVRWEADFLKFQDDPCYWKMIVDTQGEVDVIKLDGATGKPREHQQIRAAVKWFAGE
jgi:hypothetical protein